MALSSELQATLAERLTADFYAWERRGRGWTVSKYPVILEPPFRPFFHKFLQDNPIADDARRPGILERLLDWFRRSGAERTPDAPADEGFDDEPDPDDQEGELIELQVRLPPSLDVSRELAERMLLSLSGACAPVGFELIGLAGRMVLQFACRDEDAPTIRQVLEAFVPEAAIEEAPHFLENAWSSCGADCSVVADFGLSREFMLPLEVPRSFKVDPLLALVGAEAGLGERELTVFQVLFTRAVYPWAESIARAMTDSEGGAFFADAPETLALAGAKISRPLFAVVVRVGALAPTEDRAWALARLLGGALSQFTNPASNEFVPLTNDAYPEQEHATDLVLRRTRRSGMILGSDELASIVHLPSASVRAPELRGLIRKTKAAPSQLLTGDVALGENIDRGKTRVVRLGSSIRLRHMHLMGATGSGKSTLLKELLRQDIEAGRGVGLLDPHGDLADEVLDLIPEARYGEVVIFDPSDEEAPVGFNVLGAKTEREKQLLTSDLVAVFRRFSTSWGDQMTAVLGNAILAFLERKEGGTLLDLRRFLVERAFREHFLRTVEDPAVRSFWMREFPLLKGTPQASILTRLDAFLRPRALRRVVSVRERSLDLGALMERGGIFIGKLSQGAIGEENARLLGSLLVAKFQQVALARERLPESERRDFFLYLDEFHHFVTPSLTSLLGGARKYHVGLVLAHHELRQLRDPELQSALLTNAATRVCFRLGDEDARQIAQGFASFDSQDLQSLGISEAICRVERADHDFTLAVRSTSNSPAVLREERCASLRKRSRTTWGTPREEIDRILALAYGTLALPTREQPDTAEYGNDVASGQEPKTVRPERKAADLQPVPRSREARASQTLQSATASGHRYQEPGRGGAKHKYLQSLIKHYAESKGYRATLEAPGVKGGRIDVLLERGDFTIACEISIGSTGAQECAHVQTCLAGGYSRVIVLSPDRRRLRNLESKIRASVSENDSLRVSFFTLEELVAFLERETELPEIREETVLGYLVRTNRKALAPADEKVRHDSIVRTIVQSLRRMKGGS